MKFGIDCGHNCPPDIGATGIEQEDRLTLAVGTMVMALLCQIGHEVVNCTPTSASSVSDSLFKRCNVANNTNVDVFVSIHFNVFNGQAHGAEVFAVSDTGRELAQSVLTEIVKLGFTDRNVKDGTHLYVVKNTKAPAILVECCFIDSAKDMGIFDIEKMAHAIVKGLVVKLPSTLPPPQESASGKSKWEQLICALDKAVIEFPALKVAQLAQAILESGRGQSALATEHNNFWGLKWRSEMIGTATPTLYQAWDGTAEYCKFPTVERAIVGYWAFINRPPYVGYKNHALNAKKYLEFIVKAGYCPNDGYLDKVLSLLPEAQKLLAEADRKLL
ncbi:MAG: N-acetylmuramoyl-L-alanine amidase [Scytonema sp. PMC 1069.18]|nr:N-acetylmuramoyl-L-alanine amidase [Scytonema sp. PMC 1069.18]MEC4886667.1 N-acetylmuramoyl-L-alanine amidase [Scytonema sp. PMC 1070.18]